MSKRPVFVPGVQTVQRGVQMVGILGDPGADSGDEGKSKRAEKYIWNEEK